MTKIKTTTWIANWYDLPGAHGDEEWIKVKDLLVIIKQTTQHNIIQPKELLERLKNE